MYLAIKMLLIQFFNVTFLLSYINSVIIAHLLIVFFTQAHLMVRGWPFSVSKLGQGLVEHHEARVPP